MRHNKKLGIFEEKLGYQAFMESQFLCHYDYDIYEVFLFSQTVREQF